MNTTFYHLHWGIDSVYQCLAHVMTWSYIVQVLSTLASAANVGLVQIRGHTGHIAVLSKPSGFIRVLEVMFVSTGLFGKIGNSVCLFSLSLSLSLSLLW